MCGATRRRRHGASSGRTVAFSLFRTTTTASTPAHKPVRLLHYSYLPLAMSVVPDPNFFLNNPYQPPAGEYTGRQDFYSEAKIVTSGEGLRWRRTEGAFWYGNFFPDMRAWD